MGVLTAASCAFDKEASFARRDARNAIVSAASQPIAIWTTNRQYGPQHGTKMFPCESVGLLFTRRAIDSSIDAYMTGGWLLI